MDTPAILDVAIGLALLYLMLSLLVSVISESISRLLDLRAKTLREWLEQFLEDPASAGGAGALLTPTSFYSLPLIAALKNGTRLPSYIPSRAFATALLDLALPADGTKPDTLDAAVQGVKDSTALPDPVKAVIISHLRAADGKLEDARKELALWFDEAMERVSGWYTRKIQIFTLLTALIVTLIANADTFLMVNTLWQDDSFRQAVGEYADSVINDNTLQSCMVSEAEETSSNPQECLDTIEKTFSGLKLPLFEHAASWQALTSNSTFNLGLGLQWLIGLIVTTAALSFGARFWFDVLTKLVNIRLTGKPPTESRQT